MLALIWVMTSFRSCVEEHGEMKNVNFIQQVERENEGKNCISNENRPETWLGAYQKQIISQNLPAKGQLASKKQHVNKTT